MIKRGRPDEIATREIRGYRVEPLIINDIMFTYNFVRTTLEFFNPTKASVNILAYFPRALLYIKS